MKKILNILKLIESKGYEAYIVGGFVRDMLLNIQSFDVDICTNAKPDELKKIIPSLIDKDLFCSYFKLDEYNIEITTYRLEYDYDGRRPRKVAYASTLKDDLKRRDFTINTICMNSNGKIIDYYRGIDDLKNKIIKCVEDTKNKIREDYLRILRAIRFSSTLNMDLENNLKNEIIKNKDKLLLISSYRKREELNKLIYGNISIIKSLDVESYLEIKFPKILNRCTKIIGMYAQCEVNIANFFNKQELKQYNLLHKYYLKKLDNYDLFILGKDNLILLEQMNNKKYLDRYDSLIIKSASDIDYELNKINKEKIIMAILDGKLENKHSEIEKYI